MKSSPHFKQTILAYLENQTQTDELFAPKFNNPAKNIDDCITYILNRVKESGCQGFHHDEIYGMAIHYYQEENIKVGKEITNYKVVVDHPVEFTEEEKAEAKEAALKMCIQEEYQKLHKAPVKAKQEEKPVFIQTSLFQ